MTQVVLLGASTAPGSAGQVPISVGGNNVLDWGDSPYVVANGRTPAAIRAAIAALPTIVHPMFGSIPWGTVKLPPGVYTWSSADAVVNLPSYVHLDGLKRAIMARGAGYTGLLFGATSAITQFALNELIWDNGATANLMWEFPCGCSEFDQLWARYQNTSGTVGKFDVGNGTSTISSDITLEDIRLAAVGSPSNTGGIALFDVTKVRAKGFKTYATDGGTALNAVDILIDDTTTVSRDLHVEDVEASVVNATVVLVRTSNAGAIEGVTVKNVTGEQIGTVAIQKGLVNVGEEGSPSTAGQGSTHGIHVEGIVGRDWWGSLVSIGSQANGGGDVKDFVVANIRGDSATVAGSVDTTRNSSVLNVMAQDGEISGVVARNCGLGGVRFLASTFQPAAHITATGLDVASCVQNPSPSSFPATPYKETGIFFDSGCFDITLVNPRSVNNYSAANIGGSQVGAGIGMTNGSQSAITLINPTCTDTRSGGSQFQDVGVRLGLSGSDGTQPNNVTIIGGDLGGNGVAPIYGVPGTTWPYATTDHGHRLIGVRNTGLADVFAGSAANALTGVTPSGGDNSQKLATTAFVQSLVAGGSTEKSVRKVLGETIPITSIQGVSTIPSGELTLMLATLVAGTAKGIAFRLTAAAVTMTLFELGLYDLSGNLLASTADQSGTINSSGFKQIAFSSTYAAAAGAYYVGAICVYSAGAVQISRGCVDSSISVSIDSGKTPAVKQTGQSSLPNPASYTAGNNVQAAYHFAVYS